MRPAQPLVSTQQLSSFLLSARKSRGLSQTELASRLALSQNRLSELERNPGSLSVSQLLALCDQLGLQLLVQPRGADSQPPSAVEW